MKTLLVTEVPAYGKKEFKPDCDLSRKFAELLRQKHLTERNVEVIKSLGFSFEVKGRVL